MKRERKRIMRDWCFVFVFVEEISHKIDFDQDLGDDWSFRRCSGKSRSKNGCRSVSINVIRRFGSYSNIFSIKSNSCWWSCSSAIIYLYSFNSSNRNSIDQEELTRNGLQLSLTYRPAELRSSQSNRPW